MESPPRSDTSHRRQPSSRPYRSKRHPPCVQCRRKKLRCDSQDNDVCQRCETAGIQCSFSTARRSTKLAEQGPLSTDEGIVTRSQETETGSAEGTSRVSQFQAESAFATLDSSIDTPLTGNSIGDLLLPSQPAYHFPERSTPQAIQTLDGLKGFSSQVIGASGESDPWLLRHCKFDDHGFLPFHLVHFRNAGGVPLDEKIPVHFLVTADQLYEAAKEETRYPHTGSRRDELNALVPLQSGQRLVSLWVVSSHLLLSWTWLIMMQS